MSAGWKAIAARNHRWTNDRLVPEVPAVARLVSAAVGCKPVPRCASSAPMLSWIPTAPGSPMLALAPMQDVTDLPFWRLMARYGGADVYYTEYFRVHATSHLEKYILRSIEENPTG